MAVRVLHPEAPGLHAQGSPVANPKKGEEDEDFDKLVDFAESVQFERLGVFKYSDEEDTAAYDLDGKLDDFIEASLKAGL